jgi:hypothetical protein
LTFGYFASFWAVLSFLLILGPLFSFLPSVRSWLQGVFSSVASVRVSMPISLLMTTVAAFYLFTLRDDLHQYSLSLTFQPKQRTPLPLVALRFFVIAVVLVFVLGFAVTSKDLLLGPGRAQVRPGSPLHLIFMFAMTGCLVLIFTFFALAAGLMAVYEFGIYAEARMPDPIYLSERLMLNVVMDAVQSQIGDDVKLYVTEMRRTTAAGMTLQLHQKGKLTTAEGQTLLEEKGWLVEADLWARLRSVVERGTRIVRVQRA